MTTALLTISIILNLAALALLVAVWRRARAGAGEQVRMIFDIQERMLRAVREEVALGREDAQISDRQTRQEVNTAILNVSDSLQRQIAHLTQIN